MQVTVRAGVTLEQVDIVMGTMRTLLRAYASGERPAAIEPVPEAEAPATTKVTGFGEDGADLPFCDVHNTRFFRNERGGRVWYSHKIAGQAGSFCKYEGEPGRS